MSIRVGPRGGMGGARKTASKLKHVKFCCFYEITAIFAIELFHEFTDAFAKQLIGDAGNLKFWIERAFLT